MDANAQKCASDSSILEKASVSVTEKVTPDRDAFDFDGDSSLPPPPQLSAEEEKKLWRKIDFRLMPILSLMYLCSFLDRGKKSCLSSFTSHMLLICFDLLSWTTPNDRPD